MYLAHTDVFHKFHYWCSLTLVFYFLPLTLHFQCPAELSRQLHGAQQNLSIFSFHTFISEGSLLCNLKDLLKSNYYQNNLAPYINLIGLQIHELGRLVVISPSKNLHTFACDWFKCVIVVLPT